MTNRLSRRRLIALSGAASVAVLAGCNDEGPGEEDGEDPAEEEEDPAEEEEEEDPAEDEEEDDEEAPVEEEDEEEDE